MRTIFIAMALAALALPADSQPAREPMPVVDLNTPMTQQAGHLRGYAYVRIEGELALVPIYSLAGDCRVFRTQNPTPYCEAP